ncbi:MAG: Sec-independent protein translocase protein TatC [Planctomycetota bacterium]|jgi:sec-independent protein translocase protein TatC
MSFGDHLQELRTRVFRALVVPLPLAVGLFFIAADIRALLVEPLFAALRANGQTLQIQALSPAETITTDMKLAVIGALSISAPWLLYQLWKFVEPGLYTHERRYVHFLTPLSSVLTVCAIFLFYWILLPFTLLFLVGFGAAQARTVDAADPSAATVVGTTDRATTEAPTAADGTFVIPVLEEDPATPIAGQAWISADDQVMRVAIPTRHFSANAVIELASEANELIAPSEPAKPQLRILEIPLSVLGGVSQVYRLSEYITFTLLLLAGSVIAFQMPVAILLLGWVGIVNPQMLREKRRWALFVMAIISAIVTPPDITSMVLMLGPLWMLYEFGILLLRFVPAHRVAQGRVFSVRGARAEAAQTEQTEHSGPGLWEERQDDWHSRDSKDDDAGAGGRSS